MILLSALLYGGCKDVKVGYLFTHNAKYNPDSVVFKKFEIPWQSQSLEGVQGTNPIRYSIERIDSDHNGPEILSQFSAVQKGIIQLPWNHTVPQGKYIISLRISNEGYSVVLDSMIIVIIK